MSSTTHLLSLKVLRCYSSYTLINNNNNNNNQQYNNSILLLPSSFGTIYLGETFTILLSIIRNNQTQTILKPKLLVELQQQQQHTTKTTTTTTIGIIQKNQITTTEEEEESAIELLINHHITQTGLHSLICTVTYNQEELTPTPTTSDEQQDTNQVRSFRKLYKFNVLDPLVLRITKVYRSKLALGEDYQRLLEESLMKALLETSCTHNTNTTVEELVNHARSLIMNEHSDRCNGYYVIEIQVQNQSTKPLLELTLQLSKGGNHPTTTTTKIQPIMMKAPADQLDLSQEEPITAHILPGDIHQYSLHLRDESGGVAQEKHAGLLEADVRWMSVMGEPGSLTRSISYPAGPGQVSQARDPTLAPPSSWAMAVEPLLGLPNTATPRGGRGRNGLFAVQLVEQGPRRVAVGSPFQVTVRISLTLPYYGDESIELRARLLHLLDSLALHLDDQSHSLLLLSPLPLLPSHSSAPDARDFRLQFLPLHLSPPIPLHPHVVPLGRLAATAPHLNVLFGLAAQPSLLGSVYLLPPS
ncbi:hypothetical protein PCANC_04342 [Puccinia coronata f. sp. avenae]|uniref:Trafficking protein particle complex subunit 13 N-terminal domain-containing protein n=1 Tax=Puccinia coronata f. sp. avenae TaxID=200324 RepID=A0A2N5VFV8_9BASI|nr:hypothetical protein PCANC_04342 [Puccinia coronata f. sp. avenae]PLW48786.1 hypothetical protein PCASD_03235 [Puccinia coronata f. sp. avenae]